MIVNLLPLSVAKNISFSLVTFTLFLLLSFSIKIVAAQPSDKLTLPDAVNTGLTSYPSIKAKQNYFQASSALIKNTKNEYLPNVIASVQQDYGTINGQFGPLGAVGIAGAGGGLATASSGPVSSTQSWNASFGALYLATVNWEFFSFGRVKSKIELSHSQSQRHLSDLTQEQFIHSVRVSSAYLNLLISQRLIKTAESNLTRVLAIQKTIQAKALSGLVAGVDSSLANAEVSKAKLLLIEAHNSELQNRNQLAQYLNVEPNPFLLDTLFLSKVPTEFNTKEEVTNNPQAKFYKSRLSLSEQTTSYLKKSILPGFNFFSIVQTRGSGFNYNYTPDFPDRYSKSYFDGINPTRSNYLLGVSLSWNIMSLAKIKQQVNAQKYISAAYQNEYDLISSQLHDQLILSDQRITNSLASIKEAPIQLKAATDAFAQKNALYKNGLATMVELQQALYTLTRAEADLSVAYINVWQALLQKAAASGDFNLFILQAN